MSDFGGSGSDVINSDDDDDSYSNSPFKWVVVPIAMLVMAAIILFVLRVRQRKKQIQSQGINALQRDVEAMGPDRARHTGDTRWQWAEGTRAGRRLGLGVRGRDEGLNELGEAPPAYSPPTKKPGDIELHEMNPPQATYQNNSTLPSDAPHTAGTRGVKPPTYGEARDGHDTSQHASVNTSQHVSSPASAVLPNR